MTRVGRTAIGFAVVLLFVLPISPICAEWRRAESANFIVYSDGSESRLRTRVQQLEDFDQLLRTVTSVHAPPAPNKLHVYIVSGLRELQRIRQVPPGVAGFYTATPDGIAAFVDGNAEDAGNEVLFHEYCHHFMMPIRPGMWRASRNII